MNRDDVTRIAREAGFVGMDGDHGALRRFAALVAAAAKAEEREACAKVCEVPDGYEDWEILGGPDGRAIMNELAAAIRARGEAT